MHSLYNDDEDEDDDVISVKKGVMTFLLLLNLEVTIPHLHAHLLAVYYLHFVIMMWVRQVAKKKEDEAISHHHLVMVVVRKTKKLILVHEKLKEGKEKLVDVGDVGQMMMM